MRLVLHDYSGHPFQMELSRQLARASPDDEVLHVHSTDYISGKGNLLKGATDPENLSILGIDTSSGTNRYRPASRLRHELLYAWRVRHTLQHRRPDVAIYCNVPLLAHWLLMRTRPATERSIFWHQDVYSAGIRSGVMRTNLTLGRLAGLIANRMERTIARKSDLVVAISDAFLPVYRAWGVSLDRVRVIANWAPLDELPLTSRDNPWSKAAGLHADFIATYSGTLGLKHRPQVLMDLAQNLAATGNSKVVVISEGLGRDYLEHEVAKTGTSAIQLMDYQDYSLLPQVLGAADVLLAVLEPEASAYSVPSKVWTYMCAGRPIVALVPPNNQAAVAIQEAHAGFVVEDELRFIEAVRRLAGDADLRKELGANARRYAEETFDISRMVERWSELVRLAASCPL